MALHPWLSVYIIMIRALLSPAMQAIMVLIDKVNASMRLQINDGLAPVQPI